MVGKLETWLTLFSEVLRVVLLILNAYLETVQVMRQIDCFRQFPTTGRLP